MLSFSRLPSILKLVVQFDGERDTRTPHDFSGNAGPGVAAANDEGDDDDDADVADEPSGRRGAVGGGSQGGKMVAVKQDPGLGIDVRPFLSLFSLFSSMNVSLLLDGCFVVVLL